MDAVELVRRERVVALMSDFSSRSSRLANPTLRTRLGLAVRSVGDTGSKLDGDMAGLGWIRGGDFIEAVARYASAGTLEGNVGQGFSKCLYCSLDWRRRTLT